MTTPDKSSPGGWDAGVPSWQRHPRADDWIDPNYVQWLTERVRTLQQALGEAIEGIESWAAYASDYFREKHGLADEVAALRAVLHDKEITR